jgi:hypothetical protein
MQYNVFIALDTKITDDEKNPIQRVTRVLSCYPVDPSTEAAYLMKTLNAMEIDNP